MQTTIKQGQSFIDKTLELTGSIEHLVEMSIINNTSITDDLKVGNELLSSGVVKIGIVNGLRFNQIATKIAIEIDRVIPLDLGIGEMVIGQSFSIR